MTTKELSSGLVKLFASKGCVLRQKGSDPHSEIGQTTVKAADLADWEEVPVEDTPPYTKAEYDAKVSEMVRVRYSADEEFAIQRKVINSILSPMTLSAESAEVIMTEYATYNNYVEDCKVRAKDPAIYHDKEDVEL